MLELGCGERVPSVRLECEAVVRDTCGRGGRATLIRINPEARAPVKEDDEEDGVALADHTIVVRDCALAALTAMDVHWPRHDT